MPYGAKRRRGYAGYASKGFKKRKKVSLTKKIKDVIRSEAEVKNFDFNQGIVPIPTTGTTFSTFHIIKEGLTTFDRVRSQVLMTKIGLRYSLHLPTTQAPGETHAAVRIMVLKVTNTDGNPITVGNILSNLSPLSFNQLQVGRSFTTLMDRTHDINTTSAGMGVGQDATGEQQHTYEWFKEINFKVFWNASSGALSENHKNSIQALAISNMDKVELQFFSRVRFLDL